MRKDPGELLDEAPTDSVRQMIFDQKVQKRSSNLENLIILKSKTESNFDQKRFKS